uniref:Putative secreted protein n=1 Tax=Anopheles triannulatus TaxID=58253 RepID=A0A2M4B1J5_9DIPT
MYVCIILFLLLFQRGGLFCCCMPIPKAPDSLQQDCYIPNYLPLTQLVYFYIQHLTIHNDTLSSPLSES